MIPKAEIIKDALIRIKNGNTSWSRPTPADLGVERFDNATGALVAVNIRSLVRWRLKELAEIEAKKAVSETTFKRGLSMAMDGPD